MNKLFTSETTDQQLYRLALLVGIKLEPIVFKDELIHLPKPKRSSNYIINLGTTDTGGTHWVALYIEINRKIKVAYYFNSFSDFYGKIPIEVMSFIKRIGAILYVSNDISIQNPRRGFCGEYSIDFLVHMNNHSNDSITNYKLFLDDYKNMDSFNKIYKLAHPDVTL
jgi:hypothetical protein